MTTSETLIREIEVKREEFKNENYPMSIGELVNLYINGEVVINPDFQRFFRWSPLQKTRLIESIMLRIPLPSIFVFQREDGIWEIVDGLQRVSTILQFMGVLEGKEPLTLQATKYLPHLENFKWENEEDKEYEIPDTVKLNFKRVKLNLSIIIGDTGANAKFEVFQRLNTGGSYASDQEVRNSVMIMVNKPTYEWFIELAANKEFQNTLSLSDRLYEEQYNVELVLRHIALLYYEYTPKKDIKDFFDDITEKILLEDKFDYEKIKDKFISTFSILNSILDDNTFKRYDGTKFKGKFLESAFEAISIGVAYNIDSYSFPQDNDLLIEKIQNLHSDDEFKKYTGSGTNARTRIPNLLPFIKTYFRK
ncbi:DUF262 domain-containing protein [Sulfurimonas microaerophilic]|uniref:DUF262 domain-containing protein n=1 Tax=Sulfurimonas microaerophilic TaxID=3058392 RepID=UPI002714D76E|nr:DUF262 domain-containing protein [Sulfurimonas sp. hsl 1-7]